ncbi:Lipid A biosynthesis lauroyl acyltransferase [Labilithrix luteola]|uniref:Lipid A biosynthesis lauroyl acyltransferase n=1 Tax=Labilithrix luteola TaxID=1391654 RepID=A0A0K1Q9J5_9BACT|nr:lipid A biosynthesis acyltransferase [Labilithrix luteola]AKV02090.1 Lipid A biosynthesis lauroyl acyltransferase [Labilithrix luteola]
MVNVAADRREGQTWTLAQRTKNDVLWLLATGALALGSRLPRSLLVRLGEGVGVLAHTILPSARRTALRNVERVFPELGPKDAKALVTNVYRTLGRQLGEVVATLDPNRPLERLPFAPGTRECFDDALREGHGVVFASAHLGPWERVAATLVAEGFPLTVIAREAYDPRLTPIYDRLRGGRGVRTIYRGAPGAAASLLRTVRRGEVLGVPMDLASRVPSIDVPFLGLPARTPVGPARIALRTSAAVIVGTPAPRDTSSAELVFSARRIPTGDLGADAEGERILTSRINEELGARIRAMPERWVWMHPRWRS